MIGLLILLASGLGLLWVTGVILSVWLLTHPPRRTYSAAVSRGRPGDPSELADLPRRFETWFLETRGLRLPVWDIPGDEPNGPTVVMTHGWADSKIGSLVRIAAVAPIASRIIAWDLPGHGEAPGSCRLGTKEVTDVLALLDRIGGRVVLMGWSLGAGVSIAAAAQAKAGQVAGVIAEAPYRVPATPASNVLHSRGLPALMIVPPAMAVLRILLGRDLAPAGFDRAAHASRMTVPLLVIHGTHDVVCPAEDSRAIVASGRGMLFDIAGGGHNNLWTEPRYRDPCERRVREFVRAACGWTIGV